MTDDRLTVAQVREWNEHTCDGWCVENGCPYLYSMQHFSELILSLSDLCGRMANLLRGCVDAGALGSVAEELLTELAALEGKE